MRETEEGEGEGEGRGRERGEGERERKGGGGGGLRGEGGRVERRGMSVPYFFPSCHLTWSCVPPSDVALSSSQLHYTVSINSLAAYDS